MAGDMIRVECACGKAARVPSRYAGRQVKCSGCGEKLTIPDGSEEPAAGGYGGGPDEGYGAEPEPSSDSDYGSGEGAAIGTPVGGPVGSPVESRIGGRRGPGSQGRGQGSRGQGFRDRGQAPRRGRSGSGSDMRPRRRSGSGAANDPYAPPQAEVDEDRTYRRRRSGGFSRDLTAEAHIVAIGIWQRIWGVLTIAIGGLLVLGVLSSLIMRPRGGMGTTEAWLVLILGGGLMLGLAALYYQIGVAMMKYAPWSRVAMVVLFVLGCCASS